MKKLVLAAPILALALGGSSACATKKMVRQSVGEVNDKVDTLSKSVEENQERTRANEGQITEVDQKAQAAGQRRRPRRAARRRSRTAQRRQGERARPTRSTRRRSGSSTKWS